MWVVARVHFWYELDKLACFGQNEWLKPPLQTTPEQLQLFRGIIVTKNRIEWYVIYAVFVT